MQELQLMIIQSSSSILSSAEATLLAGLLGLLGGMFSRTVKYWHDLRTQKKKTRASILAEIQVPKSAIEELDEADPKEFDPVHTSVPTSVFEENIDDIGLLSAAETPLIIDYYSIADVANEQLNVVQSEDSHTAEPLINTTIPNLREARKEAENVVNYHTKILGKHRYRLILLHRRFMSWIC